MLAAFWHLAIRAWCSMVAATNTNTLGLLLWAVGIAVAIWIAGVTYEWIKCGAGPRRIRNAFGKSLPVAVAGIGVIVLIVCVWGVFLLRTVYYEHSGMRWAYIQEVQRNQELSSQIRLRNRGITSDDPAYMGLVQILREFQGYGSAMQGKPCTIVFTSEPDSLRIAQAIAETSALVSTCRTFGPDAPEMPDSISNKEEGTVPGAIVVHSSINNHAAISFQRGMGNLLPTRYSYIPPKNPSFAMTENVMWLQFGNGVGWRE